MGRTSTIDKLAPEVLEKLQAWLRDKSINQEESANRTNSLMKELGIDFKISRSAVNRYARKMDKVGAKLQQSREISEMWIAKLGNQPQGKMGALQNEMLRGMIFELMMKLQESDLQEQDIPELVKIINKLALTQQRLEQASTINEKREEAIRKQVLEAASKSIETSLDQEGASAATILKIKQDLLNLK